MFSWKAWKGTQYLEDELVHLLAAETLTEQPSPRIVFLALSAVGPWRQGPAPPACPRLLSLPPPCLSPAALSARENPTSSAVLGCNTERVHERWVHPFI